MSRARFTIGDIRASQDLCSVPHPYLMRLIFIPAGWVVTTVALRTGAGPNLSTIVRLVVALVALGLMCAADPIIFITGIIIYYFALILDHVDGNLCRLNDRASYFGKFLDGVVDSLVEILLPLALAVHAWLIGGGEAVLIAGAVASAALALTQIVMLRSALTSGSLAAARGKDGDVNPAPHPRLTRWLDGSASAWVLRFFDMRAHLTMWDFRNGGLVVAVLAGAIPSYLFVLALAQGLVLVGFSLIRSLRCYVELDVHRRSKSAVATR